MRPVAELRAEGISVSFGGNRVLDDVSLEVHQGELVGLIGPNGAGKTTLFEVVSGFTPPTAGTVWVGADDITTMPTHQRARASLSRSFQDAKLFSALTASQVIQVALERHVAPATDAVGEVLRFRSSRRAEAWSRSEARRVLKRFGLAAFQDHMVSELSTGMRRILELAAVMAPGPRVLLLDEPTAGVAQAERDAMLDLITSVRAEQEVTILLIEHDVPMIMQLSDRIYVLEAGSLIAEGEPAQIAEDPQVIAAYLGEELAAS